MTLAQGRRTLPRLATLAALLAGACSVTFAAPVTISYLKDATTHNTTGGGTDTGPIFFATPGAGVPGPTYSQAAETVSVSGGGATSSTTYSAFIEPGALHASSLSTTTGPFSGSAGQGLATSAQQSFYIVDSLTASGGAAGSTVSLTLTLNLDAALTSYNVPTSNAALCGYGSIGIYADVGISRVASLGENLCAGSQSQSVTATFDVIDGTAFDLMLGMDIFTQSAIGAGDVFGSGVSIDALNTGRVSFTAPAGIQLLGSTGHSYLQATDPGTVPEPGALALACLALAGAAVATRRS